MTSTRSSPGVVQRRIGTVLFIAVLVVILAMASVALARVDEFGGAPAAAPYAAYTVVPYAPYTAGPVVKETPFAPYTEEPYAPYTAGPVVREVPYAPYTENSFEPHNIPR